MRAALAQTSMTLWRAKHRKGAIFRRKMSGFEVFLGLREHEVRSNPCLMPICRAIYIMRQAAKGHAEPWNSDTILFLIGRSVNPGKSGDVPYYI